MNKHQKLLTVPGVIELESRLSQIPEVARFDAPGEPQGHTIAHALDGWENSFSEVLDVLLPKLTGSSLSSDELNDVLLDIGEEFRHILYHLHDTKYFEYILGSVEKE